MPFISFRFDENVSENHLKFTVLCKKFKMPFLSRLILASKKDKKKKKTVQHLRDFPELPERKRNKTEERKHLEHFSTEHFSTEFINSIVSGAASGGKSRRCNAVLGIA
jgi:hypothetical protein